MYKLGERERKKWHSTSLFLWLYKYSAWYVSSIIRWKYRGGEEKITGAFLFSPFHGLNGAGRRYHFVKTRSSGPSWGKNMSGWASPALRATICNSNDWHGGVGGAEFCHLISNTMRSFTFANHFLFHGCANSFFEQFSGIIAPSKRVYYKIQKSITSHSCLRPASLGRWMTCRNSF